jgi:hypothetical protein
MEEPQPEEDEPRTSPVTPEEAAKRDPKTATTIMHAREPDEVNGHKTVPRNVMIVNVDGQDVKLKDQIQVRPSCGCARLEP